MAEKEPIIVIKKITVEEAGHHGGSWKVALADFMTALMAFFLVMWLISQSQAVKENVADYFSTPSIIEYNFSNYGAELTLEKLFLDLMNEPLKFFQAFMRPADYTPNIMAMGSKKVALHHVAEAMGEHASNVEVARDQILFEIPARELFNGGTAEPSGNFVNVMEKVNEITTGLEDSNVYIDSQIYYQSVPDKSATTAQNVSEERLDLVTKNIQAKLEHPTVDVYGKTDVSQYEKKLAPGESPEGLIRVRIKSKPGTKKSKNREFKEVFGESDNSMSVYDQFVEKLTKRKKKQ